MQKCDLGTQFEVAWKGNRKHQKIFTQIHMPGGQKAFRTGRVSMSKKEKSSCQPGERSQLFG